MVLMPQTATINMQYPASLQGRQNIEIRPRIEGYLEKILIDEGSVVKRGQVLFQLDGSQYEQNIRSAEADSKMAAAEVNVAQMQLKKAQSLVAKEVVSHFELEAAEYALQAKQAALAQANARLQNAKTNLSYTIIRSPSNGVVGNIPYRVGSLISGNSDKPLTTVSDISSIYAYFSMNEKEFLAFIRRDSGKSLQQKLNRMSELELILADGSIYPDKGKIETVSGILNPETGSANFRAVFPNPKSLIRSGGSATICIPENIQNAILVPQKATYEIQGKRFVYMVGKDGEINASEISVLSVGVGQCFVVVAGVNSGDTIVVEGVNSVKEKMMIKPKPVSADSLYKSIK